MTATIVAWVLHAATIALAYLLQRKRPEHRPFAIWAAAVLAEDLVRACLNNRLSVPGPYAGTQRALFHADQALYLVEPIGLAALSWVVFLRRRPWAPLTVGALVWLGLCAGYPFPFRGPVLGGVYAVSQAAACAAVVATFISWTRRRAHVRPEHAATLFAGVLSVSLFAGPYASLLPEPWADWSPAIALHGAIWLGLLVIHAAALWGGMWQAPSAPTGGARMH